MTSFVTDATGFIGTALVRNLTARGHQVFGLAPSADVARHIRHLGGVPVMGDLSTPGQWQDTAAVDWVFHLPPFTSCGPRLTRPAAAAIARTRLDVDAHLLDALASSATERIVYVGDASAYGATGPRPITEDAPRRPSARAGCLTPALDRLDGYVLSGLPVITAFPGWVYGNGSWLLERVIEPVLTGRPVRHAGRAGAWVSPIHVQDCARALAHLAEHGEVGGRYFVANTDPVRLHEVATTFARLAMRPIRVRRVPAAVPWLMPGWALDDYQQDNRVLSNIRLRALGFRFMFPTLEEGLQQVVGEVHA